MKIAYLAHWDCGRESGVLKKMRRQIRAWEEQGHQVALFAFSPSPEPWNGLDGIETHLQPAARVRAATRVSRSFFQQVERWGPDLVYFRFNIYYPGLAHLMKTAPTFVEINSDDLAETRKTMPGHVFLYHRLTRGRVFRGAAGLLFLTQETAARYGCFQKPFAVIGDSVDLSQFPELAPADNDAPRLVFIASSPAAWHGIDKILWLAEACPEWQFDLVGMGLDALNSRPANVTAHGYLGRSDYERVMARADAALATLALHRIGMSETTPLKVREYLAYGIPTIIGYHDTDFSEPVPFLLELANTPENVSQGIDKIRSFVMEWKGHRVSRADILHLDVRDKEKKRLSFFEEVLDTS